MSVCYPATLWPLISWNWPQLKVLTHGVAAHGSMTPQFYVRYFCQPETEVLFCCSAVWWWKWQPVIMTNNIFSSDVFKGTYRNLHKYALNNTLNMLPVFKDLRVAVWPHNCCLIVDLEWSVNTSSNLRMTEWIRSKCLMCFVGYAGFVGSGSSTALQKIIRYSKNAAQCVVTLPRCSVWTLYKCSLNLQMFLWCVNERLFRE